MDQTTINQMVRLSLTAVAWLIMPWTGPVATADPAPPPLASGAWVADHPEAWTIGPAPRIILGRQADGGDRPGGAPGPVIADTLQKGERNVGILRSPVFEIVAPLQTFAIAGWDGSAAGRNDADNNCVRMISEPDGAVLRRTHVPGGNGLVATRWVTSDLIGRRVRIEVVDANPAPNPAGFAWIAFADYRQDHPAPLREAVHRSDLYGLRLDPGAEVTFCRSLPFLVAPIRSIGAPGEGLARSASDDRTTIAVGAVADAVYLLGMINEGWDHGVAHWGEHPELRTERDDQLCVGARIGELELVYAGGRSDRIPLVLGATAWFAAQFAYGGTHGVAKPIQEPFASRPELARILDASLLLKRADALAMAGDADSDPSDTAAFISPVTAASDLTRHQLYYLALRPRPEPIESIVIHDNPAFRGRPLVSGVTLALPAGPAGGETVQWLGQWDVERADLEPAFETAHVPNFTDSLEALAAALYTGEDDLPRQAAPIDFPAGLDAARLRFLGGREAAMLSNVWVANLAQMDEKFEADTGFFHETGRDCPFYGGYSGIGTWINAGIYHSGAFGRCSDHYVTLALRCLHNPRRWTSYVDFVDEHLYFYRNNHDPAQGPDNTGFAADRYPADAPPHWSFTMDHPSRFHEINELPGNEELDGHGATIVGRWTAWRQLGAPAGDWLRAPRPGVFGKSRWEATRDAADFIVWLMDYTGRDVIWSEGETTAWGGHSGELVPPGMAEETDPVRIRANYANANMYEVYPSYVCMTALRCSAQMADAAGDTERAARWRAAADRIQAAMLRLLRVGDFRNSMWRVSPMSVYPSMQDSLVPAWFSIYYDGYDPARWDPQIHATTRNTLARQLAYPYGRAAVLGMGYGQGWLTHAALMLDEMDDAGPLLTNIAKYSYDKNMDYADPARGIDWRPWLWLIPEGTNILPGGRWHRIGDLTNGANQGPAMHAMEAAAGIDDTDPAHLRLLPRVPAPLEGLEVSNFGLLIPVVGNGTIQDHQYDRARVNYVYQAGKTFRLTSDRPLPDLSLRLGPFAGEDSARAAAAAASRSARLNEGAVVIDPVLTQSGHFMTQPAWWIWITELRDVRSLAIDLTPPGSLSP